MKHSEVHYVISGYKEVSYLCENCSSFPKCFISPYSQRLCTQKKYKTFFFNQEKDCINSCTRSKLYLTYTPTTLEFFYQAQVV